MEVEEARKRKERAEEAILLELRRLQDDTGLSIRDLSLDSVDITGRVSPEMARVSIDAGV